MHRYEVGKPYSPTRRSWPERYEYNWRSGAHELRMFARQLNPGEVLAVKSGKMHLAFLVYQSVIDLAFTFDAASGHSSSTSIPWSDAPYTWHMLPAEDQAAGLPPELAATEQPLFTTLLVEATNGLIQALRVVSLPNDFARVLHQAIRDQAAAPFNQRTYDTHLAQLQMLYPTVEDLAKRATARATI